MSVPFHRSEASADIAPTRFGQRLADYIAPRLRPDAAKVRVWEPILLATAITAAVFVPWTPARLATWLGSHLLLYAGMSVALHRYFSHRSFATGRVFQAVLGIWGSLPLQAGPLSWAAIHRRHHRHCDQEGDPHSPQPLSWRHAFHAHLGWLFEDGTWAIADDLRGVRDFTKFPELVWIQRWSPVFSYAYLAAWVAAAGWVGFIFGWLLPRTTTYHCTALVNSVNHMCGYGRERDAECQAGNVWWTLPLQLGENWHANHHAYPGRSSRSLHWWEIDPVHWLVLGLAAVGLVWDVRGERA